MDSMALLVLIHQFCKPRLSRFVRFSFNRNTDFCCLTDMPGARVTEPGSCGNNLGYFSALLLLVLLVETFYTAQ